MNGVFRSLGDGFGTFVAASTLEALDRLHCLLVTAIFIIGTFTYNLEGGVFFHGEVLAVRAFVLHSHHSHLTYWLLQVNSLMHRMSGR